MSRLEHSALAQLTLARLRELMREPEAIFWTFVFPILIAFGLGIAFRDRGPETVHVGIEDTGAEAAALTRALSTAEGVEARMIEPGAARRALRDGNVALVVEVANGGVVYRYVPSRPESRIARLAIDDALQRAAGRSDPRPVREEPVEERGTRYIDFLIPGLIGLNLLGTGLWGVGHTVVRMRTGRLLKRLVATPMRRSEFLLSFILARLLFLVFELAALLAFGWFAFGVAVRGSLASVALIATVGALAFSGLGLLVASRARTTEAVMGLMNLVSIPMWILSGVFFSSDRFPDFLQPFIAALPLTAVLDALRAVMLNGAALAAVAASLAIAAAWAAGSFTVALAIFRWR